MPSLSSDVKSTKFEDEIFKSFLENLKEAVNDENFAQIWENELKREAKRTFTLLPLEVYESSVFKELELLACINKNGDEVKKQHKSKSISISSLRKSLSGSGSSFNAKIQSFSADNKTKVKYDRK